MPGEAAWCCCPPKEGATDEPPVAYRAPLPADCHGAKTGVFLSEVRDYSPLRDCVENEEGGVNCASTVHSSPLLRHRTLQHVSADHVGDF